MSAGRNKNSRAKVRKIKRKKKRMLKVGQKLIRGDKIKTRSLRVFKDNVAAYFRGEEKLRSLFFGSAK